MRLSFVLFYQSGQWLGLAGEHEQGELSGALEEIASLMAAKANTPEGDRLGVLTMLVEAPRARALSDESEPAQLPVARFRSM
jgi:antitoxin component HigA of HigAB toxin-antitoxin module